jgi:hypothetical protein
VSKKDEIKKKFESGSTPSQVDFEGLIDFSANATYLDSGELSSERLPQDMNINSITADGSGLTNLTASNLLGSLPDLVIANIDASKINLGKLDNERLPDEVSVVTVSGDGSGLTHLMASAIEGEISNSRLPSNIIVNSVSGNGADITDLNPDNISGVLPDYLVPSLSAEKINSGKLTNDRLPLDITANSFFGNGSGLTGIIADNISSGTLSNDYLSHASETQVGITRFANISEAIQSEVGDKAISPKQLAYVMSQKQQEINDQLALVKAGLKFRDNVCAVAIEPVDQDNVQEIDGYQIQDGDRVLLTNQENANENNVWIANATLPWEIAEDLDNDIDGEMAIGISVEVINGDEYANTYWSVSAINDGIIWKKRNDLNDFDAGNGIIINGLNISADENWIRSLNELTAGSGIRLDEGVVSADQDWIKQLTTLNAGAGITVDNNIVSADEAWIKELTKLSTGNGITINNDIISADEGWVKQVTQMSAGDGITIEDNTISSNQEWVVNLLESRLGEGLVMTDNKIRLDESWLNNKISQQILLHNNVIPESIPEATPLMMEPVDIAPVAIASVVPVPVAAPIKYQTLTTKPTLAHMENLAGHGVYSIDHLKSADMNALAYFENGSNNIKLFDLSSKSKVGEINLSARPGHVEYSTVYDALFYSMNGSLYQLSDANESSIFLENVNDFFFTAAGNRCVTRYSNKLNIFDMVSKKIIQSFEITVSGRIGNRTLGSSYNGEYLAVATGYKKQDVQVFDVKKGTSKIIKIDGASATYSPTPSEDGSEVYVGGGFSDGHIYIYNVADASFNRKIKPFSAYVYQVKPTADPNYVVTGGYNGVLKIINIKDGTQWWSSVNIALINEVTVSSDLKRIYVASGAGDARFSVFDIK